PSPSRIDRWPVARSANQRIANCCRLRDGLTFVDVATPMLRADGTPRPELYLSDRLHMTRAGYDLWTSVLRPHLIPPSTVGRPAGADRGWNA
ncbi:MAG: GDSL family lipase, partial [Armatimonadota bacterium]